MRDLSDDDFAILTEGDIAMMEMAAQTGSYDPIDYWTPDDEDE